MDDIFNIIKPSVEEVFNVANLISKVPIEKRKFNSVYEDTFSITKIKLSNHNLYFYVHFDNAPSDGWCTFDRLPDYAHNVAVATIDRLKKEQPLLMERLHNEIHEKH